MIPIDCKITDFSLNLHKLAYIYALCIYINSFRGGPIWIFVIIPITDTLITILQTSYSIFKTISENKLKMQQLYIIIYI